MCLATAKSGLAVADWERCAARPLASARLSCPPAVQKPSGRP